MLEGRPYSIFLSFLLIWDKNIEYIQIINNFEQIYVT